MIQILAIISVFITYLARPFAFKSCIKIISAKQTSILISVWVLGGGLLGLPFFWENLILPGKQVADYIILFSLGLLKGAFSWLVINNQQVVNKESVSSSSFSTFIALGFAVLINNFLLGEDLSFLTITSIFALGVLGLLFFIFGHAKELSSQGKKSFCLIILILIAIIALDRYVIVKSNWYFYLLTSGFGIFLLSIMQKDFLKQAKSILFYKRTIIAGLIFLIGEYVIIYTLIVILPVSIAHLVMRLTIPIVMVSSVFIYKEGKWQEQLFFGLIAYILVLPLIL